MLGYVIGLSSSQARRSGGSDVGDRPRLEGTAASKNAPRDARQFVGERNRKDVVMQPLFGRLDPRLEPMALPALRLDQHDPRRLHEQDAQLAIAAL